MATLKKHRVLILGVSGFLGGVIYRELHPYFQTFGTYKTSKSILEKNTHFHQYDFEEDDIFRILNLVEPTIIISSLRGDFSAQLTAHKHLYEYVNQKKNVKFFFYHLLTYLTPTVNFQATKMTRHLVIVFLAILKFDLNNYF